MQSQPTSLHDLAAQIKAWAKAQGFQDVGITDCDLDAREEHLQAWLNKGFHGEMDYMARHGVKRSRPAELLPGTTRVISVRMDYLPPKARKPADILDQPG